MSSHPCRLINPRKEELDEISKTIIEKTSFALVKSLSLN